MLQEDRDRLIEVHTIVKGIAPLVEKHEKDINKGKGIMALIIFLAGLIGINHK